MIDQGIFDQVDFAMMVHPGSTNMVHRGGTALVEFNVSFQGHRAHSSTPESGVNALKALIQTFTGLDALQGELPLGINVNGIIKEGGEASNIIPDKASAEFTIRGLKLMDLKVVKEKIMQVVRAAEVLTGAKASYSFDLPYAERYPNQVMGQAFKAHLEDLGETVIYPKKDMKLGSSDIGNVSLIMPVIHPYIKIGSDLTGHTLGFTKAAASQEADDMIIKAAKALGGLTYQLLSQEDFRQAVRDEFTTMVPDYKNFSF